MEMDVRVSGCFAFRDVSRFGAFRVSGRFAFRGMEMGKADRDEGGDGNGRKRFGSFRVSGRFAFRGPEMGME